MTEDELLGIYSSLGLNQDQRQQLYAEVFKQTHHDIDLNEVDKIVFSFSLSQILSQEPPTVYEFFKRLNPENKLGIKPVYVKFGQIFDLRKTSVHPLPDKFLAGILDDHTLFPLIVASSLYSVKANDQSPLTHDIPLRPTHKKPPESYEI